MTSLSYISFSQLLMTRFCHDITGPIGAINNGVEFLAENNNIHSQAMSLIGDSALQAMARVQFYRYLYGIMKDHGIVDFQEKKALAESFYQGDRINLIWKNDHLEISHECCRILFNLLLIASAALIRGGDVHISSVSNTDEKKQVHLCIHATGSHVKLDDIMVEALLKPNRHHPDTKTVQAYYTAQLASQSGATLSLKLTEESLTFDLFYPHATSYEL